MKSIFASGPWAVSAYGDAGCTARWDKGPNCSLIRHHKECDLIKTAGRWSWKSIPAKECVTTHRPNQAASKINGAPADTLFPTGTVDAKQCRVGDRGAGIEAWRVSVRGAGSSADLGGSSNYKGELTFELKWRRVPQQGQSVVGNSVLSYTRKRFGRGTGFGHVPGQRKGSGLKFPQMERDCGGFRVP